eukprot:CAMPEP_0194258578 /NCGR_PEP_ID=MMETSP0158-20130606/41609_1 /TAXON_ID=33649 /ORGANISM="Thalassionema nitzschioides, Strain L26-B" /LENGTH=200 /DNA_ID=CAMNT_0038998045 /DNA_START=100 /DNA_END=698 /DNA_ORIENTATION=-
MSRSILQQLFLSSFLLLVVTTTAYPSCQVCGSNKVITLANQRIFAASCVEIHDMGIAGQISPELCALIPDLISATCGCEQILFGGFDAESAAAEVTDNTNRGGGSSDDSPYIDTDAITTASPTESPKPSPSPSKFPTVSPSLSIDPTVSPTKSYTPTRSIAPSSMPTESMHPSRQPSPSPSESLTPTESPRPSPSPSRFP